MKNTFLLLILTIFLSCKKDKPCEVPIQIIGKGEIVSNALIYQPLITSEMQNNEHIIRVDSQDIFNLKVSFDNGVNYDSIDFNRYTLLGKFARENCTVTFDRNVVKDDVQKKYYYTIKVYQCGNCQRNWESMNWVLVPIIPDDYDVVFKVENK